jgi:hypothetical protein
MDAVLEVARRTAAHREAREQARQQKRLRVADLQAAWSGLMREHWPDAVDLPWTGKARGQLKHAIKAGAFAKVDARAFVEYVVAQWTLIGRTALHWMTGYPPTPSALLLCSNLTRFLQAYADRETHLADMQALGVDGLRAKYRRGGMDREAADKAAREQIAQRGGLTAAEAANLRDTLRREQEARLKQERLFKQQLRTRAKAASLDDTAARSTLMRRFEEPEQ